MKKKIGAIGVIAVLLVGGIGLAMAADRIYDPEKGWGVVANEPPSSRPSPDPEQLSADEEEKEEGYLPAEHAKISRAEVYRGPDKETAELVAVLNVTSYVTRTYDGITIVSGRTTDPYSIPADDTDWIRVYFPITFSDDPNVVWTNEVYPYDAKAHYAIDRGWISTSSFDARITTVDELENNYIQFFAAGPV